MLEAQLADDALDAHGRDELVDRATDLLCDLDRQFDAIARRLGRHGLAYAAHREVVADIDGLLASHRITRQPGHLRMPLAFCCCSTAGQLLRGGHHRHAGRVQSNICRVFRLECCRLDAA